MNAWWRFAAMAMVFGIVVFVYLAFLFKRGDHDPEGAQRARYDDDDDDVKDGGREREKSCAQLQQHACGVGRRLGGGGCTGVHVHAPVA